MPRDRTWRAAKSMIGDVGVFLNTLLTYDKNHIPGKNDGFITQNERTGLFVSLESSLKAVDEYLRDPEYNPDSIRRVSFAAAGLCAWAVNIVQYYRVYCEVEPKRLAAEEATEQLRQTEEQFNATQNKLAVSQSTPRCSEGKIVCSRDYKPLYKL